MAPIENSWMRLGAGIILGSGFLVATSIVRPDWTRADDGGDVTPAPAVVPASLGSIETVRWLVEIEAGDPEPRFTVRDRATGEVVARGLRLEEMATQFPDLDPADTDFGAPTTLMLHESAPSPWD